MSTELAEISHNYSISLSPQSRLDDSLFSKELAPHYMNLAGKLASSGLVPKSYHDKPQDLFICWAMGHQIGIPPEQSMQCISVINGRPAMWGDDMLALCIVHPDFEDIIEEPIVNDNMQIIGYTCTVKRRGMKDKVNIFTLEMAKKAGLLAKGGVWTQYPERMLKLRARGFTLRDAFPDALKGIKPREEVEDYDIEPRATKEENISRIEKLKKDLLSKKDEKNDPIIIQGIATTPASSTICDESTLVRQEMQEDNEHDGMDEPNDQENPLHTKIKELLQEKQFTDERLKKALNYYEAETIEEINDESARHFIEQLNKL